MLRICGHAGARAGTLGRQPGVVVRVIAAEPDTDAIERGRLSGRSGEACGAQERGGGEQKSGAARTGAEGTILFHGKTDP